MDYPRCPICQWAMVKCKRYCGLMKKIQSNLGNVTSIESTLTGSPKSSSPLFRIKILLNDVKLSEQITAIIKRSDNNTRHHELTELFVDVISLFQKLDSQMEIERDKLLKSIYEHVEKNNSIFLTRQQWSDLENEYNRLIFINRFRAKKELLGDNFNGCDVDTLDEILSGPNPFSEFASQVCNSLLEQDGGDEYKWKSILPDKREWSDFEKDRLLCDGKWVVCPKGEKIILYET
jgi:hypothetical protein